MFYESIEHVTTLFYALENKVLKIESNAREFALRKQLEHMLGISTSKRGILTSRFAFSEGMKGFIYSAYSDVKHH